MKYTIILVVFMCINETQAGRLQNSQDALGASASTSRPLRGTPERIKYDYNQAKRLLLLNEGDMEKYVRENPDSMERIYGHTPTDLELASLYEGAHEKHNQEKDSLRRAYRAIMGETPPPTPTPTHES